MRLKLLLSLIVMSGTGSALSAGTAEPGFAAISQCLGPSDMSEYLQRIVRAIVSATDSEGVKVRAALQVPLMRPSAVALVANASTCSRAAQAMNVAQDTLIADRRLYVFALGDSCTESSRRAPCPAATVRPVLIPPSRRTTPHFISFGGTGRSSASR
jgi:hypothetical protein